MPDDQNLLEILQVVCSFGLTDGKIIFIYSKTVVLIMSCYCFWFKFFLKIQAAELRIRNILEVKQLSHLP